MRWSLLVLLLLPLAAPVPTKAADDVVIYRCTDRSGHLTFRDTPCSRDQAQQTRTMLRPKDAPPGPIAPPSQRADDIPAPSTRVVVVHEPRPLYECVPPDGDPYTSDTPAGHPRWVPLWTLGIPYGGLSIGAPRGIHQDVPTIRNDGTQLHRPYPHPGGYGAIGYGAGTWIRDECHALPQADVCARLLDRRDEIRRRFFNAMPTERDTLNVEERSINARLDADCASQ